MPSENSRPVSFDEDVVRAFEHYLTTTLEVPSPSFGDLPACPFVHAERTKKKIRYEVGSIVVAEVPRLLLLIEDFMSDASYTNMLIIDPFSALSKDEGIAFGVALNDTLSGSGFFAACIHPDDQFQIADYGTREPVPHMAILVQSRKLLAWGRSILGRTSYYDRWSEENLAYVSHQIGDR